MVHVHCVDVVDVSGGIYQSHALCIEHDLLYLTLCLRFWLGRELDFVKVYLPSLVLTVYNEVRRESAPPSEGYFFGLTTLFVSDVNQISLPEYTTTFQELKDSHPKQEVVDGSRRRLWTGRNLDYIIRCSAGKQVD